MAKAVGRACALIAILLTIYGSIQCVKAASDYYDVTSTLLTHTNAQEPVRLPLQRQRRAVPAQPTPAPVPANINVKNQYQSVSASAANLTGGDAATITTTVDSNAAASVGGSVSYNVHNVGANGTGQRKDYSVQTADGQAAVATTINVAAAAGAGAAVDPKKPTLLTAQFPKKVPATPTQQSPAAPATATSDKPLIDNVDVAEDVIAKEATAHSLNITEGHHDYYNSSMSVNKERAQSLWLQMHNISENKMLSSSHRRAMTVELKFDFPFYGHNVRNITVATGGFLYTGEYVHSWLAATQYIAPLMANFDTSISDDSYVRMLDNGTAFTVVWENVALQDKPEYGNFTFSATLHKSGDIVFVYYQMPTPINTIEDNQHPVKVGLSDAYIIDKFLFFARRKTIYEYHRATFQQQDITNATIIHLTALPTCLGYNDCQSCINHKTTFECAWCPTLNRCSMGTDRKKHEWLQKGCDRAAINQIGQCPVIGQKGNNAGAQDAAGGSSTSNTNGNSGAAPGGSSTPAASASATPSSTAATPQNGETLVSSTHATPSEAGGISAKAEERHESKSVGVAFGFLVPICLVFAVTLWLFYAYRNPRTKSGQLLIQFRPSNWSWRRGEARYTAATIHM